MPQIMDHFIIASTHHAMSLPQTDLALGSPRFADDLSAGLSTHTNALSEWRRLVQTQGAAGAAAKVKCDFAVVL